MSCKPTRVTTPVPPTRRCRIVRRKLRVVVTGGSPVTSSRLTWDTCEPDERVRKQDPIRIKIKIKIKRKCRRNPDVEFKRAAFFLVLILGRVDNSWESSGVCVTATTP